MTQNNLMQSQIIDQPAPKTMNDVVYEIEKMNPDMARIIRKYMKSHAYGLVFEHNLPEGVRLWSKTPEVGDTVNILPSRGTIFTSNKKILLDNEESLRPWNVEEIIPDSAGKKTALLSDGLEKRKVSCEEIVPVVGYKDVIYPGLKVIDKVERGNPDDPYHMIINAENYHALEALAYAYAGKVDCIYIDPPYNTGAKDWKYNNDYVGADDQYRHSKWIAFMERRLKLAKQLLNPEDSVMIVTIDEKEYLRLGMLLEQLFPEARIQMISSVINPSGVSRMGFSRTDEYIYTVMFGEMQPIRLPLGHEWSSSNELSIKRRKIRGIRWDSMMRRGSHSTRTHSNGCYYPIYVNPQNKRIEKIGTPLPPEQHRGSDIDGLIQVLPIRTNGAEGVWQVNPYELKKRIQQGRVKVGKETSYGYTINYLSDGVYADIMSEYWTVDGYESSLGNLGI